MNESKRRNWLNKWVKLETNHHPKLKSAELAVYEFCMGYAKNPSIGRTLVLYGDNGCGKSHIVKSISRWAKAVALRLPLVDGHDAGRTMSFPVALFANWAEVVDGFKPPRCDYQIIEDYQVCSLLTIDDIGAEHDPSKIGVEKLYVMLNRREKRWNIFTTNFLPEEWPNKFDNKISSRLFRNAQHIDMTGVPDYSTT